MLLVGSNYSYSEADSLRSFKAGVEKTGVEGFPYILKGSFWL